MQIKSAGTEMKTGIKQTQSAWMTFNNHEWYEAAFMRGTLV